MDEILVCIEVKRYFGRKSVDKSIFIKRCYFQQDWSSVTGTLTKEDRIWYTIFSGIFQYLIPLSNKKRIFTIRYGIQPTIVIQTFSVMISLLYIKIFHFINVSISNSLYVSGTFILFLSEKADEQQPKQQETEKNQYNPLLNITDFFLEVNKVQVVTG